MECKLVFHSAGTFNECEPHKSFPHTMMTGFFGCPSFVSQRCRKLPTKPSLSVIQGHLNINLPVEYKLVFHIIVIELFNERGTHKSFPHTMMTGFFWMPQSCKPVLSEISDQQTQLISYSRTSKH